MTEHEIRSEKIEKGSYEDDDGGNLLETGGKLLRYRECPKDSVSTTKTRR